ncbi:major capsid protein [Streptococcus uberis]|uniref:major capsid protein n=1 Tax=Streptococcus uberis TaxID=1349 RepID=UPI001FF4B4A5|nr:major capsid protein [Streptococcus uberis]MCK1169470.1 major capsid protein [Streptococcus uberis]MCK1227798.1 major capsid protein [Streptococcus uberis]
MANDITKVLDVITPEVFNQYMEQYTAQKSLIISSGVAIPDERVSKMISAGGKLVHMPFWNDLSGDDEVLSDSAELGTGKITAGQDIAVVMYRGRGWSANELAAVFAGSDPVKSILSKMNDYWVRQEQKVLLAVLKGLFTTGGALASTHLLDASTKNITASTILDAKQLLGDAANKLQIIVMHSAVYTKLQKDNLIQFIQATDATVQIPTYLGYRVVVDDSNAPEGNVYTTYLLASGSFGRNTGEPADLTTFETSRKAAAGVDEIFTRRAFVYHPYGVKFTSASVAGLTPSNAELATAANWEKVYDDKNIGIVAIKHLVDAATV